MIIAGRRWSRQTGKEEGIDGAGYMFNPQDEQSALNLTLGAQAENKSVIDWSKEPGFTGFTSGEGNVGGRKVTWKRWSDAHHLYSECVLSLPMGVAGSPAVRSVRAYITANTKERRGALEESMATLQLQGARP